MKTHTSLSTIATSSLSIVPLEISLNLSSKPEDYLSRKPVISFYKSMKDIFIFIMQGSFIGTSSQPTSFYLMEKLR